MTDAKILMKAATGSTLRQRAIHPNRQPGKNIHAIANHDTFFIVRGREKINERINPTTPNTIEQVPWSVKVFIITVKVNR